MLRDYRRVYCSLISRLFSTNNLLDSAYPRLYIQTDVTAINLLIGVFVNFEICLRTIVWIVFL